MIAVPFPQDPGSFQGHRNRALPVEHGVKVNDPGGGGGGGARLGMEGA